jgi:hypothetical protein
MALPLKYNTASQTIILGPFLDDTDGKTPETALTIANTDIKLKKHNATSDASKNSGGATHIANGYYYTTLDATDTNTIGRLVISVNVAGALPVWHEFIVYPAEPFDYLFAAAGTDYMKVDIAQVDGVALGTHGSGQLPSDIRQIVGAAVSTTTAQLGVNVVQVGGTSQTARDLGAQCDATISSRAPASTALSNAVWTDAKAGYIDVAISSRSSHSASAVWDVTSRSLTDKSDFALSSSSRAAIVDEVWDELRSGHTTNGTFGQGVASVQGNVTGSVGSVTAGVTVSTNNDKTGYTISGTKTTLDALNDVTASAVADAVWDELTTGHNTAGSFAKLFVDTLDATISSRSSHSASAVWDVASRSLTDKTGFELSSSGIDAVWDRASALTLSFETLLIRAYQMINNKMVVNETTGNVDLKNIGGTLTIATGNVASSSGSTTRAELSWS